MNEKTSRLISSMVAEFVQSYGPQILDLISHPQVDAYDPYVMLGVKRQDDMDLIRDIYRIRMRHLRADVNMDIDIQMAAARINKAFEEIARERGEK